MSFFDNIKRMISPLSDEDDDYDEIFDDGDSPFLATGAARSTAAAARW